MIAQGGTQSLGLCDFKRQLDAFGGVDYFRESLAGGYLPNARVMLNNGEIVQNISGVNNTRNPNIDMAGWYNFKLSQSFINDGIPYSSAKYSTTQQAVDSTSENTVYLQLKSYNESIDLNKNNLIGRGYGTVINVSDNRYGIKSLQTINNWDKMKISNLSFLGGESKNNTIGVTFDPNDAVSGRRNIEYCSFVNLDIAIKKPTGNIGNTYSNLNIRKCNYAIKANSVWSPQEMHSGNDTWSDFQVDHITTWGMDYTDFTGGGAIHIKDGIFEYCDGGGIRLEYSNDYPPFIPPRISNIWFEQVAKASSVVRDGVTETPRNIKLVNTAMCIIDNCKLDNIELVNSTALALNCRASSNNIILDSTSNLIVENAFLHGSVPSNVTISSIAKQSYPTHFGANLTLKGNSITGTVGKPAGSSVAVGITFKGNIGKKWAIDGSSLVYADTVSDSGVICSELALNAGKNYVFPYIATPANQWVVWGISVKQVGSLSGSFKFGMDYNLGDIILKDGEWTHSFGIARSPAAAMNIRAILQPSSNGMIRIRDYFIVSFPSESDAIAFVNSRKSLNTYPDSVQVLRGVVTIPANSRVSVGVDFLGLSLGDNIVCSFNSGLLGIGLTCEVTSQNVATVYFTNNTASPITLSDGKLVVKLV